MLAVVRPHRKPNLRKAARRGPNPTPTFSLHSPPIVLEEAPLRHRRTATGALSAEPCWGIV